MNTQPGQPSGLTDDEAAQCAAPGKPRRPDDRLFDYAVLVRGLLRGTGLLALLWQGQGGNRYFNWMALLAVFLAIPPVARLFSFALPPMPILGLAALAALLATIWFEAVKSALRGRFVIR